MIKIGVGLAIVIVVYYLMRMRKCNCKSAKQAMFVTPAPAVGPMVGYETPVQTFLAPVGEGYAEYPAEDYQDYEEEGEEEYMDSPSEYAKPVFKTDLLS
jgi:hypothetical protein